MEAEMYGYGDEICTRTVQCTEENIWPTAGELSGADAGNKRDGEVTARGSSGSASADRIV